MKRVEDTLRFRAAYRAGKLYVRLFPRAAMRHLVREMRGVERELARREAIIERQHRDGMSCES